MEKNLNFNRTLVAMAALVIVFAGIKLAAEIVVPFLLALFIAIICSPVIKAMTQRKVPHGIAIALLFILILIVFFFLAGECAEQGYAMKVFDSVSGALGQGMTVLLTTAVFQKYMTVHANTVFLFLMM